MGGTDVAAARSSTRLPALDGLRGVAVLAVVAFHADFGWSRGGFLGVDMFFVLSGFLITSILRDEHARRHAVSFAGFWSRRARRLFPALGLLCLGLLVFAALRRDHPGLTDLRGDMLAGLGYVANWRFLAEGDGYFATFAPSPLRHLWSLAIEEQFYLVWPLVFLGVVRLRRPAWFLVSAALVSAVLMAVLVDPASPSNVYDATHTHAHGLLLGAALAFVAVRPWRWLHRVGIVAAALMALCVLWFDGSDLAVYRGGLLAFELLTVVVIAACLQPGPSLLSRGLAWKPLRAVGLVSYGLYLWHWPVFVLVDEQLVGLQGVALLVVQLAITVALTLVSYFAIEQPFRRGTLPGVHPVAFVPLAAGGLVAMLLVVSASLESPIEVAGRTVERQRELTAAHRGTVRVLLVGDSAAETLAPGLDRAARARGMEVVTGAAAGCPLDWHADLMDGGDGTWYPQQGDADCAWPRTWPKLLRRYRPDVVLISFGLWDARSRRIGTTTLQYRTADWTQHMARQAEGAVRVASGDGARVGILLSGALLSDVGPFNQVLGEVAGQTGTATFDLGPLVDGRGAEYRWDGVHYTASGSAAVGGPVAEWVAGLVLAGQDDRRAVQISSAGQRRAQR